MRVGLVGPAGIEEPHPRRQRGRHVEHSLTGSKELLGQQRAEPAGGLDRPRSRCERLSEAQQPVGLAAAGVDAQFTDDLFGVIDDCCGVGPLVRVDPDDEHVLLLIACPLWWCHGGQT